MERPTTAIEKLTGYRPEQRNSDMVLVRSYINHLEKENEGLRGQLRGEFSPYARNLTYDFVAGESWWEITSCTAERIDFQEAQSLGADASKRMAGSARLIDGKWALTETARQKVELFGNKQEARALESFFNEHGPPPEF